jgi:hypothetical protein
MDPLLKITPRAFASARSMVEEEDMVNSSDDRVTAT